MIHFWHPFNRLKLRVIPNISQGLLQGGSPLQYLQRLNIGGLGEKTEVLVVVTDWPWSNTWYSLLPSSTIHFRFFSLLSALKFICISWGSDVDHHPLVVFLLSGSECCNFPFIISTGHGNCKRCTSQFPEFQASSSLPTLYIKKSLARSRNQAYHFHLLSLFFLCLLVWWHVEPIEFLLCPLVKAFLSRELEPLTK